MKVLRLVFILALGLCLPFFIWGKDFESWFTGEAAVSWLRQLGPWGWCGAIGLLVSDLVLPVPATAVMSALGFVYGAWWGGAISAAGSILAGLVAYGLTRALGRKAAAKFASAEELARYEALFRRSGPWLVALSRWMPLLPEVIACLAGLSRMPLRPFVIALCCGSLPLGFVYAAIGAAGHDRPLLALVLSLVIPGGLILATRQWLRT
ncbi:MAG: TVP38/TMEM64 family protein [Verrucomicrobiales bacterium]